MLAEDVRALFHNDDVPVALVEHELLKLKRRHPNVFRELKDEFGMEYLT